MQPIVKSFTRHNQSMQIKFLLEHYNWLADNEIIACVS